MSYCRFENTLRDLRVCLSVLENGEPIEHDEERRYAKQMLEEMLEFVLNQDLLDNGEPDKERMDEVINECPKRRDKETL